MPRNRNEGSNRGRGGSNRSNESMFGGWSGTARERPLTTAAVAAATVGAGVFLWSRRNQISDQLSQLSDQISDWTENMRSSEQTSDFETAGATGRGSSMATGAGGGSAIGGGTTGTTGTTSTGTRGTRATTGRGGRSGRTTTGMSETGGGNASLGAHSGTTGTGGGNL